MYRENAERRCTVVDLIKQRKVKLFEHICRIRVERLHSVSQEALDDIEQWPVLKSLSLTPSLAEVSKATRQMSSGKAAGPDGIPAEVFKHGGMNLNRKLTSLLRKIWSDETVPQEFRNANVIHLYKRKGDRASCDNHRGISLLVTGGKILEESC